MRKTTMKKLIALLLVLTLASTLTLSALVENGTMDNPPSALTFGTLPMLNMTEEEYLALDTGKMERYDETFFPRP